MIGDDIIEALNAGFGACLSPEGCKHKTRLSRMEVLGGQFG